VTASAHRFRRQEGLTFEEDDLFQKFARLQIASTQYVISDPSTGVIAIATNWSYSLAMKADGNYQLDLKFSKTSNGWIPDASSRWSFPQ